MKILNKLVISQFPEKAYRNQLEAAQNMGRDEEDLITEDEFFDKVQEMQRNELKSWFNYILSEDAYPLEYKYLVLRSVSDSTPNGKGKRSKTTADTFPPLNPAAVGKVYDELIAFSDPKSGRLKNEKFNFTKLYLSQLSQIQENQVRLLVEKQEGGTEGLWIKYNQDSDPAVLAQAVIGSDWCTEGVEVAKSQLKNGDFYVYFTNNKNGVPTIPRIAIRMEDDSIGEIRGAGPNQELEEGLEDKIITKFQVDKIGSVDDIKEYSKKAKDMKQLTTIHKKHLADQPLDKEELKFLYEIDSKIKSFGYEEDPRINLIKGSRDLKIDLSIVMDCNPNQISTNRSEAHKGGILYHYGNLDLGEVIEGELILPKIICGELFLGQLTTAKGLILTNIVKGYLDLGSLTIAEGVIFPQTIDGDINLNSLTTTEGLILPQAINGSLSLRSLTTAEYLTLPNSIGGSIDLDHLANAKGLKLPQTINGSLFLTYLKKSEGLTLPSIIKDSLYLSSLTTAKGLILPHTVGNSVSLVSLVEAEGLVLPTSIGQEVNLLGLKTVKGLILQNLVCGNVNLPKALETSFFDSGIVIPEGVEVVFE